MTGKTYDESPGTNFTYDLAGRLRQRTDAKGQVTSYTYFPDNSLKQVTYANGQNLTPAVCYTYDQGYRRLTTMTDGTGTTRFTYLPTDNQISPPRRSGRPMRDSW